jgi:hypothetical protein
MSERGLPTSTVKAGDGDQVDVLLEGVDLLVRVVDSRGREAVARLSPDEGFQLEDAVRRALKYEG